MDETNVFSCPTGLNKRGLLLAIFYLFPLSRWRMANGKRKKMFKINQWETLFKCNCISLKFTQVFPLCFKIGHFEHVYMSENYSENMLALIQLTYLLQVQLTYLLQVQLTYLL